MITDDDILRFVSHRAFEAAIEYQMEGRVHDLRTLSDGTIIKARVKGSGRTMYAQTIQLARGPEGRLIPSGSCTCPVGFNCKHVAAVLFEYQEQAGLMPDAGVVSPQQPLAEHLTHHVDARAHLVAQPAAEPPLPYDVDAWLRTLDAAQQEEDYPPTVRKRLLCWIVARIPGA